MRTITKTFHDRIIAQAEEAEVQGLTKLATNLTDQAYKNATYVRDDNTSYTYSSEDYNSDVEAKLWDVVIRTADFHNASLNLEIAQHIIEKNAARLIAELSDAMSMKHGVGAYEPTVPGESRQTLLFSLGEDE